LADPSYEAQRWHQFLIYIAFNAIAFLINAYLTRLLPLVTQSALYWSIGGWLIIMITILACSSPTFQTGHFVYGEFINETGWPDGFSWLLGLLQVRDLLDSPIIHCFDFTIFFFPNPTTFSSFGSSMPPFSLDSFLTNSHSLGLV
jgi:hypothetical protein